MGPQRGCAILTVLSWLTLATHSTLAMLQPSVLAYRDGSKIDYATVMLSKCSD